MDISQFKNKLGAGGARPNQFLVTLTFPAAVGVGASDDSLLVTSAALPASNVNPTIVQYRGREVKMAGERTFDPWTITILNDTSMRMRQYFERWSNLMNNRTDNGGALAPGAYMCDLQVEQLDRNDAVIRGYEIYNAFPITVSEVALAYSANDVISEFNVTFQYSHFEVTPV
jgi:hypothetical protein